MKLSVLGKAGAGVKTLLKAVKEAEEAPSKEVKRGSQLLSVRVPDERVDRLSKIFSPQKTTYAKVFMEFLPAEAGEKKLPENTLQKAREADALVIVLKAFKGAFDADAHNPLLDLEEIVSELLFADVMTVEKRIEKLKKQHTTGREPALMEKLSAHLEKGALLSSAELTAEEIKELGGFAFLTIKPLIAVFNVGEGDITNDFQEYLNKAAEYGAIVIVLSAELEAQIAELPPEERAEFLKEMGVKTPARDKLLQEAYNALNLVSYLTVGEDEVRAWATKRNSRAPEAASVIHTDLQKNFIKAEVVSYDDFISAGTIVEAKKRGIYRLEGKEYIVKDGDIISFRAGK